MSRRVEVPPRDTSAPVRVPRSGPAVTKPKKPSGVFSERHTSAQELLYREWLDNEISLVFTFDDAPSVSGVLRAHDTYALHVEATDGQPMLIFKQALRSIHPL